MPIIKRSAYYEIPPEALWRITGDPAQVSAWMPDVKERQLLDGSVIEVGSRWRERGLLRGKTYLVEYAVTEWSPPARMVYQRLTQSGFRWIEGIEVVPEGAGARVSLWLDYSMPRGLIGRLFDRLLFRKDFAGTLDNRLEGLREVVGRG
jgi:uncharacterized protein YndB with AHSA1/START domain